MMVKRILSRILDAARLSVYYRKSVVSYSGFDHRPAPISLDLVSVAFNNPEIIRYQFLLLKKNLTDSFQYTVADNSTDSEARAQIHSFCRENDIPYLELPPPPFPKAFFSKSHGAALNYLYYNYIQPRAANCFGFLDHDIFPMRPVSIMSILNLQPFYGMLQEFPYPKVTGGVSKYLWPGLAFYNFEFTRSRSLDFLNSEYGDTGSACFPEVYKPLLIDQPVPGSYRFADEERINLWEGNDFQNDMYAIIGKDWLHMVNASQWHPSGYFSKKEQYMKQLLDGLLEGS
jgi:hypothetical protein